MRMVAQYALAGAHRQLVIGTDHAAEAVTGFYTKFGDGGADVLPLAGLNKRQVRALGRELGAPEPLWNKVPTADLLDGTPGQTDEAELGMTYEDIDDYLEGKDVPAEVEEPPAQDEGADPADESAPAEDAGADGAGNLGIGDPDATEPSAP